ncbi:MAG TPA: hypothetical protein VF756_31450, partial [Thermoanaerobaculia bacterium]
MKPTLRSLAVVPFALTLFFVIAPPASAQAKASNASAPEGVAAKTSGMERREGLLTFHVDRKAGKVWLEVPKASGPGGEVGSYIYVESLLTGLGSNPVGLDRGQI